MIEQDLVSHPVDKPTLVFLGDYIDRGPASRQTIDRLIECQSLLQCVMLRGNHDLIAMRCLTHRSDIAQWIGVGGIQTLNSYGIDLNIDELRRGVPAITRMHESSIQMQFHKAMPPSHFAFFRKLQNSFSCGDFLFVHGGVRPDVDLAEQREEDLLWIREPFLSYPYDFGKIVVHGHTPVAALDIRPNRINIDTGAFATGKLTCLIMEGDTLAYFDTSPAQG